MYVSTYQEKDKKEIRVLTPMYECMYVCMSDTPEGEGGCKGSGRSGEEKGNTEQERRREALCRVCQGEWRELEGKK